MTSRERLLSAMQLGEPDRVPIQVRGVRAWDSQWVATRHPSYGPLIDVVAAHGDYVESWGAPSGPFLSLTDALTSTSERIERDDWVETVTTTHTPGGDLRTRHLSSKRGLPGMQIEFAVKTLDDLAKVSSVPYVPLTSVDPTGFHDLDRRMGDRGIVAVSFGSAPIGYVHDLMGSELLAIWSIEERAAIRRLVDMFLERLLDRVDALVAAGVGPVFATSGEEYVTPPLHGARDFRELCVEPERQIVRRLRAAGKCVHVHCHGPLDAVLEDFVQIADVLHPIEAPPLGDVPLADAKRRIGGQVCLEGNIQIGDIYALPTPRLVDVVKQAIDDAAAGGGYILCPTASPHTEVLTDLTVRNYVAMVETAAQYGRGACATGKGG